MNKENEPLRKKQKMLTSFFEVESWSTIDDTLHFTVPAVEYEGGVEGAEEEEVFDDIEESEEEGDQKKKEDEEGECSPNLADVLLKRLTLGASKSVQTHLTNQCALYGHLSKTVEFCCLPEDEFDRLGRGEEDSGDLSIFGRTTALEFDRENVLLAGGDDKGVIRVWDFKEWSACDKRARNMDHRARVGISEKVRPVVAVYTRKAVSAIKWNPRNENEVAVSFSNYTNCRVYDLLLNSYVDLEVKKSDGGNACITFLPPALTRGKKLSDGRRVKSTWPTQVVAGSKSGKIRLWRMSSVEKCCGNLDYSLLPKLAWTVAGFPGNHREPVTAASWVGNLLLLGGGFGNLITWDVTKIVSKGMSGIMEPTPLQVWSLSDLHGGLKNYRVMGFEKIAKRDFLTVSLGGGLLNVDLGRSRVVGFNAGNTLGASFCGGSGICAAINAEFEVELMNVDDMVQSKKSILVSEGDYVANNNIDVESSSEFFYTNVPCCLAGHMQGEFCVVGMRERGLKIVKINRN